MSGVKEMALMEFHRSLKAMGGVSGLAVKARVGRSHLTQVLAGDRSGAATWKHVLPWLNEAQVELLRRCECWTERVEAQWEIERGYRALHAAVLAG